MTLDPARRRRPWARVVLFVLLAIAVVLGLAWVDASPSFGEAPEGDRLARIRQSLEWHDDRFNNPQPMWNDRLNALMRAFQSAPNQSPASPLMLPPTDAAALATAPASGLRITWFGHSSTLIEIDGLRLLTDPIWSERASPVAWAGPTRWYAPTLPLAQLPRIDAVLISHDHYDHLDRATVQALKNGPALVIVPLGIGAHLAGWGIPAERIVELDWWQHTRLGGVEITATPSRHASGRLNPQSDRTLWSGFALTGPAHRAYYSGDTGFSPALREIGERLGPFDVTLIEAGEYDAAWPDWHLGPEQAVEAHRLVRGKVMIPVHWGLFKLALHGWTEPAERVLAAAHVAGVTVMTPRPGQSVEPALLPLPATGRWWPADVPWHTAAERPIVATRNGVASDRIEPR